MEAKLIKTKVGYHLWLNPKTKEQEHIASDYEIVNDNGADLRKYKLSLKNCQAIEQKSLEQTEWDVEVEKENVMHDYNGNISLGAKFKLDEDGCLILKLKSE